MRKWIGAGLAVVLLAIIALPGQAAEFIEPGNNAKDVNIAQGQSHRNLYTAGRSVNINSDVSGDLYTAGGNVNLNGKIEQDFSAAAGAVLINGAIGGDARLAAGNINVNSPIGGDLLAAAGSVNIGSSAAIGGDLVVGGNSITVDGPVTGKVMIGGADVRINSEVKGQIDVVASSSLTFGPKAVVKGTINYKGAKEAVVESGAQVSSVNYTHMDAKAGKSGLKKLAAVGWLIQILALLLAAWLFTYLRGRRLTMGMQESSKSPLMNLLVGAIALVVTPILGILLFFTFIGYYVGIILLGTYILLLLVSYVLGAIYLGAVVVQLIKKTPQLNLDWMAIVAGVVLFSLLSWIPIVGWLIKLVFMLIMFGALVKMLRPESSVREIQ